MIASNILAASISLQEAGHSKMDALVWAFIGETREMQQDMKEALWNLLTGLPVPQELA